LTSHNSQLILLYNGNNFGVQGFGLALTEGRDDRV